MTLSWLIAVALGLLTHAKAGQPLELRGYVAAKSVDCFNPEHHNHGPRFYLVDDATGEMIRILGQDEKLQAIHPKQKIRIKGVRHRDAVMQPGKPVQEVAGGAQEDIEIQQLELLPLAQEDVALTEGEPLVAEAGNTLTMLSTLLVFISTDTHGCMTSETNARGRLFDNPTNANLGMQAITKGRFGLKLGNGTGVPDDHTIDLHLNVNSADHNTDTIETLALNKLFYDSAGQGGLRLNRSSWNRILLFAPGGITDSGFTAYAYYPSGTSITTGMVSMYGSSYGNNRLNGYLHELGHNFGFRHSSRGGATYGDGTCVMGGSNDGTRTQVYNAVKLLQTDWMTAFPNAKKSISADTTIDLYPISSDPNVVIQPIMVNFPGTSYYAAYLRNQEPYGFVPNSGDRDKVFVYSCANPWGEASNQVANIAVGGSYTGPGVVTFERYGPNNEYATVSFDVNDGNAKPAADFQSVSLTQNTTKAITLTGSDADGNALTYSPVTNPTNGTLSGTAPNLTYTPNNNYLGSDSFVFKVHDGKISSFATISITVNLPNVAPVANNQSVSAFFESPQPLTLTATDANNDPLSYSIVSNPSKGSLSGTLPNLTYTPNNGVSGSDSFTFRAYDGSLYSNTATVSISISTTPNSAPVTLAGSNQTVSINASNPWTPAEIATALWLDASHDPSVILNGSTVSAWNDRSGNNRHATQSTATAQPTLSAAAVNGRNSLTFDGNSDFLNVDLDFLAGVPHSAFIVTKTTGYSNIYGAANGNAGASSLHVGFGGSTTYRMNYWGNDYGPSLTTNFKTSASNILNYVWTPGTSKQIFANGLSEGTTTSAGTITAMAGGGRISNVTGLGYYGGTISEIIMVTGSVTTETRQKIEGYLAHKWGTQANLPASHPYKTVPPGGAGVTVNLNGSVTDAEQTPTASWSVVSKNPPSAADPVFGNASQAVTTASFSEVGTYVLRLTGSDGYVQTTDEVSIFVVDPNAYSLTVSGGSGDGSYSAGTQVQITADAPATGYRFVNWSTDSGGSFDDEYSSTTTYTMPANAATVTATYGPNTAPEVSAGPDQAASIGAANLWTPASLTTALWLDAAHAPSVILNGNTVSAWNDRSGNNRHATQTTATAQPTLSAAAVNGRNTLTFDGSDFLNVDLDFLAGVSHSAFIVTKTTGYNNIYGAATGGSGASSLHVGFSSSTAYRMSYWGNSWGTNLTTNFKAGSSNILNFVWTQGATKQIFANGFLEASTTGAGTIAAMAGGGRICNIVGHGIYSGTISEVIMFTGSITDENRLKIEGYLAHKWGTQADLPTTHPYKAAAPGVPGIVVNLNGSATDADGDPLTTTWSLVSKNPPSAPDPTFANASQASTTATFFEAGTYTLRLSASDGSATASDEVTITIDPPLSAVYASWSGGTFAYPFTDTSPSSNPDGDSLTNLMEFAFGTDPTIQDSGALAIDGSTHGAPTLKKSGGTIEFYFVRRKDHGTSGSVSYTPQFSNNLTSYTDSLATPTWVANSAVDANYEVVKVPFPNGTRFGRVQIDVAP